MGIIAQRNIKIIGCQIIRNLSHQVIAKLEMEGSCFWNSFGHVGILDILPLREIYKGEQNFLHLQTPSCLFVNEVSHTT